MSCCCCLKLGIKVALIYSIVTFTLVVFGAMHMLASKYTSKNLAFAWLLLLTFSVSWSNFFYYCIQRDKMPRHVKIMITVLPWVIWPASIISTFWMFYQSFVQEIIRVNVLVFCIGTFLGLSFIFGLSFVAQANIIVESKLRVDKRNYSSFNDGDDESDDENDDSNDDGRGNRKVSVAKNKQQRQSFGAKKKKSAAGKVVANRQVVVMIEGNICAGKTTTGTQLMQLHRDDGELYFHRELMPNALHKQFVNNPVLFGYTLQLVMRERRDACLQQNRFPERYILLDRSILGDFAFLLWNYIEGHISAEDYGAYGIDYGVHPAASMLKLMLTAVDYKVCLIVTPARTCFERLKKRPGNDQQTLLRYMRGISIAHYICFLNLLSDADLGRACTFHLVNCQAPAFTYERFIETYVTPVHNTSDFSALDKPIFDEHESTVNLTDEQWSRYSAVCQVFGVPVLESGDSQAVSEEDWHNTVVEKME